MTDLNPLVLVDGSSYLFRAYHALPKLMSTKGQQTGAIRGVISMIRKLMSDYPDSHIAVVFDAKGKTFRNDIYAEYKATRPPMPEELGEQIEPIKQIIQAMGVPLLVVDNVEADDVIGTLARRATENRNKVLISTGDKDLAQLVNDYITLINTMTDTVMDEAGVIEKFGVRPDQIVDYLALVGDTSDNIPGVPKCGPKTAVKWLQQYGSLKEIMEHADEIKGKVGENLRASLEILPVSYELATIREDVDLDVTPEDMTLSEPDNRFLLETFRDLEFKAWANELQSYEEEGDLAPTTYELILTEAALDEWIERLKAAELFAFDTETTSLHFMDAALVGISFADAEGEAAYVPFGHDYEGAPSQLDKDLVLSKMKPVLEDPAQAKVGQNLKYDMSVLARHGVEVAGIAFDTMLESYVLNSVASRHNMDDLALQYLGLNTTRFEDVAGKGAKQLTFNQVDLAKGADYAAEDADITLRLHHAIWPRLSAEASLRKVFEEIELPLVPVLSRIERKGVLLDQALLQQQSKELDQRMTALTEDAYELAGEEFNLGSPRQLQEIFFEKLELPVLKKTPKGQPSTAEEVLQELALDYPLPRVILEYRGLSKLKSTYTDQLPKQIRPSTGRVHTSYHQAVTATGRLSSTEPNLQNIPIRTDEGRRVRKAFIAEPGYKLMAADYSQIELRIMAHLSGDKGLLKAFAAGEDIHRATAAEVFGTSIDKVRDFQRRNAKAINFGLIYGMSAYGLGRQLNISRHDAQEYIDRYFERYPGVRRYMEETRELAAEQGYVETLFGRRLYLPEINTSNYQRRQAAERTAINAPMQGSAADIIKRAMVTVDDWLIASKVDAAIIMQVHDELVLEVREELVDEVQGRVQEMMSTAAELSIPLLVEVGVSDDWEGAH